MTQTNRKKINRAAAIALPIRPLKLWQDKSSDREARIEVLPMIDVIFCILTFFILAAVSFSRQQVLNQNIPKASTGTNQMGEGLLVHLDELGQVYVEQQLVTKNQLFQSVKDYHQRNPNGRIALHADRNVIYNDVIQVFDTLRQVGGGRVSLAVVPGESDSQDGLNSLPNNNSSSGLNDLPGTNLPGGTYNNLPPTVPSTPNSGSENSPTNQYNNPYSSPSLPSSVPPAPNTTPRKN
jgi:biopolymer transport protein ExbD